MATSTAASAEKPHKSTSSSKIPDRQAAGYEVLAARRLLSFKDSVGGPVSEQIEVPLDEVSCG